MTDFLGHAALENASDWPRLIAQLRAWYRDKSVTAPARQVLPMRGPDGNEASLLIMPAWVPGDGIGVKVVTFFPHNASRGKATINAGYLLFDGANGEMIATLEGDTLTARRTAAAWALAADYLARRDVRRLVIVGTGQLAAAVAEAHAASRTYSEISLWGRDFEKAQNVADELRASGLPAQAVENLETACRAADVVCTVTAATQPVVKGTWLKPGSHLDLIGAFKADMRECDTQAITQAQVFVDQRDSACLAGDLAAPTARGAIHKDDLQADLRQLCQGAHPGRTDATSRTVFKSAGMALQDLAAACLVRDQTISG